MRQQRQSDRSSIICQVLSFIAGNIYNGQNSQRRRSAPVLYGIYATRAAPLFPTKLAMNLTLFFKICALTLLSLLGTTRAHESSYYPYIPNEIPCGEGSHPAFVHNSYTYIAPLHKFTNITGSFFDIVWLGGCPATVTTGTDNVPGATRAGPCLGDTFNETLTMYSAHVDELMYTYHGRPYAPTLPGQPTIHVESYAETLRFESICGGRATYVDFISFLCTEDQTAAYIAWNELHTDTMQSVAASLGAPVLAGDCLEYQNKK
ncbi:hypothetical protein DFH07DRAFT_443700 [Mycena maculata]|uniref:Uncharacterized protein n=1 Tax=Mycena maculata TaxID=230809 RepID=A0AAD7JBU3_9AGAR|nr:hypothetical protein DFH07DRAFT_443700 [Mycena maculata]